MSKLKNQKLAMKVSLHTIILNIGLTIFKITAGLIGKSSAMISDAIHSLSDVISTIIIIIGIRFANKKPDQEHPYGHERFECVAAIILAFILFITGIAIGYQGLQAILTGNYQILVLSSGLSMIAAVVSIIVKEGMYWYTRNAAKKINSSALMADAWHHRSDAFSSVGSFVGILGAYLGFPVFDSVACIIICILIVKASIDIFRDSIDKMIDRACDLKTIDAIQKIILNQKNINKIDLLKTRLFGNMIYIDVEISTDGNQTLYESHAIAHLVHDQIEEQIDNVKHCMVHVNPNS